MGKLSIMQFGNHYYALYIIGNSKYMHSRDIAKKCNIHINIILKYYYRNNGIPSADVLLFRDSQDAQNFIDDLLPYVIMEGLNESRD